MGFPIHSNSIFATALCTEVSSMQRIIGPYIVSRGARGSAVCWGTALQTERLPVRFPIQSLEFFHCFNPSGPTIALGFPQPLTEMCASKACGKKSVELATTSLSFSDCQLILETSNSFSLKDLSSRYSCSRTLLGKLLQWRTQTECQAFEKQSELQL